MSAPAWFTTLLAGVVWDLLRRLFAVVRRLWHRFLAAQCPRCRDCPGQPRALE